MKITKTTRFIAAMLVAMMAIGMLFSVGCSNSGGNKATQEPAPIDGGNEADGFIPADITIMAPDDGSLVDQDYAITVIDGAPVLIGYDSNGEKIIEQELPDEFLEVGIIRVLMKDAANKNFCCYGYEETPDEWNDLGPKSRSALGCTFYYQCADRCITLDAAMAREYSVITTDGNGIFVGFDTYYLLYEPAEGEELQGGFDAMKLQVMVDGKYDHAIDNLSDCFTQVELDYVD